MEKFCSNEMLVIDEDAPKITDSLAKHAVDGEYCRLYIGGERYVVAKDFKGYILVHIREYAKNSSGVLYPTKCGIALKLDKWKKLEDYCLQRVNEAIKEYQEGQVVDLMIHLGR